MAFGKMKKKKKKIIRFTISFRGQAIPNEGFRIISFTHKRILVQLDSGMLESEETIQAR